MPLAVVISELLCTRSDIEITHAAAMIVGMLCPTCHAEEMEERDGLHIFEAEGIVAQLLNASIRNCSHCGERSVDIPKQELLEQTLQRLLTLRDAPLGPGAGRYLRHRLGWDEATLAAKLHVELAQVKAWERGDAAMGRGNELALRSASAADLRQAGMECELPWEALERFCAGPPRDRPLRLRYDGEGEWRESQSAASTERREKRATLRY